MGFRGGRRWTWGVMLFTMAGSGVIVASQTPAVAALAKSTEGFTPHPMDDRVFSEEGAEEEAAQVAAFLDEAVAKVEAEHGRPFRDPFRVFVCSSQQSLNEFIGLPPGAPIRGTVRFGDIFLAPSAFRWRGEDLHRGSLLHEMSHLHIRQHLGFLASRGKVPSWFHEGWADVVGGVGGEGVSEAQAVSAIRQGKALRPDSTGRLWTLRRVASNGLSGPMFHRQSRMFLTYIRSRDPDAFQSFLEDLLEKKKLASPFREHMGMGVGDMWQVFKREIQ